jgi:hypothetical protein
MKITALFCAIAALGLGRSRRMPIEQDLQITFGGFMKGGGENEKIEGTRRSIEAGNVLDCDIYNGLPRWRVTEIVIRVSWAPYSAGDVRDFRQHVSITPLTTAALNLRLATQLPGTRWGWLVLSAKSIPSGTTSN